MLSFGPTTAAFAQSGTDVKGSRDHPMISRIEGSTITTFNQKEFDEYRLVRGPVSGYGTDGRRWENLEDALTDDNSVPLEGKVWRLTYKVPENRSTLEIVRSFQAELTKAGFKTLYQCKNEECGGPEPKGVGYSKDAHAGAISELLMKEAGFRIYGDISDDQRFLSAHLPRAEGDLYVSVLALMLRVPHVRLDVVEVKPMTSSLVAVNAATMASDIATKGSVALYGILFDHDRAEVKPESRPTLSEISTLLKQNQKLALIVVGHTDNNGNLEYNLDLSLRRAWAVVAALTSQFGVSANRLDARGVGFLAPVAPNTTEEGRAKNRRVQLLQR
jgi:outer membrane protein OmpA-like peptidoglycan-associated protein